MRVMVAGAGGFVGRHVVREILEQTDWSVVALMREIRPQFKSSRVLHIARDLAVPLKTDDEMLAEVDTVVNLASSSDVDEFLEDPTWHTLNNVKSALHLLEWARHQKQLKAFIQVSTNEVYGRSPGNIGMSKEWDHLVPTTPYSASKAAQEVIACGWHETYGIPVAIVNTAHVFGEGQPARRFIPKTINDILDGNPVTIFRRDAPSYLHPDSNPMYGPQVRNWTYAGDLARCLIWMLRNDPDETAVDIFERFDRWNVAGREESCLAIARMLGIMLEHTFQIKWVGGTHRPGHDYRYALNTNKIKEAGFDEPYGLVSGLQRTVEWVLNERKKLEA